MSKIVRTAAGKHIDMDQILQKNEEVIAVGNKKCNARGDELGPGGAISKTRDQVMREYYALNTPVATEAVTPVHVDSGMDEIDSSPEIIEPIVIPAPQSAPKKTDSI